MVIVAFFLFVFGVVWFVKQRQSKDLPASEREYAARVGRSVHAAVPIPGFAGQAPPDVGFEPYKESVGPDESHILVLDTKGRPVGYDEQLGSTLGPYRDPDVPEPRRTNGKRRKRGKNAESVTTEQTKDA